MKKIILLMALLVSFMSANALGNGTWGLEYEEYMTAGKSNCNGYKSDFYSLGLRIKVYSNLNNRLSIGGGIGNQITFDLGEYNKDNFDDNKYLAVFPVFVFVRVRPLRNLNWFASTEVGYSSSWKKFKDSGNGGPTLNIAVGFQKTLYKNFGISISGGYQFDRYNHAPNTNKVFGPNETNSFNVNQGVLKIGFVF